MGQWSLYVALPIDKIDVRSYSEAHSDIDTFPCPCSSVPVASYIYSFAARLIQPLAESIHEFDSFPEQRENMRCHSHAFLGYRLTSGT